MSAMTFVRNIFCRITSLIIVAALGAMLFTSAGFAQQADETAGRGERIVEEFKARLEKLRSDVSLAAIEVEELTAKRSELEGLRTETLAAHSELQTPLKDATAQLKKLGDPPVKGESEEQSISQERQRLGDLVGRLGAVSKQLSLLTLGAEQISGHVAERQRRSFIDRVFEGTRSVLNPLMWYDGLAALPNFTGRLFTLLKSWQEQEGQEKGGGFLFVVFVLAASLSLIGAMWIGWHPASLVSLSQDAALRRIWRAVRIAIYAIVILLVARAIIELVTELQPRAARLTIATLNAALFAIVSLALLRGVFRPRNDNLRLVNVDAARAKKVFRLGGLAVFLVAVGFLVEEIANTTFMPIEFTIAWSAVLAIALILLIAGILVVVRKPGELFEDDQEHNGRKFYFGWSRYFFHVTWVLLLVSAIGLLASYVALAHYLTTRLVSTTILVIALVLLHHFIDAIVSSGLDDSSPVGKFLRNTVSLGERAISALGLVLSSLADVGIVLLGIPLIMTQWTLTWIDFRSLLTSAFFGFEVGDITIEPSSILLGIFVLAVGLLAARLFSAWLEKRVLARTNIDAGVRNSISTGTSYAGLLIAAGIALTSAGLDFSNLAIVAGALSLGIGFGLQSIVNNFVSGLILLAERPIKVGDWISVTGGEGIVKQINVRSTEIETFDRCSVIVPNSNLISETVNNWYHNDTLGRVRIIIGVSYDSDPEQVREILLKCARQTERVVQYPEPFVVFQNFGASSLDFELRAYIADVGWITVVGSEMRFNIFKALKDAGIEIPFPQSDVHIKGLTEDGQPIQAALRSVGKIT